MAFQTGSQVRPELADADLSGFARAGESIGAALANLGEQVGSAIEKNKIKKKEKLFNDNVDNFLATTSQQETQFGEALRQFGITGKESAGVARKALGDELVPLLKMFISADDKTIKPSSPSAMASAETYAAGLDFKYNPKTGKMERVEGPGFLRSLGNILTPGQPFGSPKTVEMPQKVIEGTTGLPQFIQQQQALTGTSDVPVVDDNDPMGILR